jgi:hypothetical protein
MSNPEEKIAIEDNLAGNPSVRYLDHSPSHQNLKKSKVPVFMKESLKKK